MHVMGIAPNINMYNIRCKSLSTFMFLLFLQAFGYLVPSHQQSKVLGVVFDSSTFPELDTREHSSTRLTVWHSLY